jgi:hypothetical protein
MDAKITEVKGLSTVHNMATHMSSMRRTRCWGQLAPCLVTEYYKVFCCTHYIHCNGAHVLYIRGLFSAVLQIQTILMRIRILLFVKMCKKKFLL